jgi:hypothetical protein
MTSTRTRTLTGALLAALALALAGCGGSNTSSSTAHRQASTGPAQAATTGSPTATTTTQPASTTTTSPPASSSTTSNSGGVAVAGSACSAADLTPAFLNSNGATGHVVSSFVLHNSSTQTCHTYGYPGIEFLDKSGAPIATDAIRTTTDFAGHIPETAITLKPGQEATFRIVTSDVASSQTACANAYGLQIIAPDDTATMKAPMPSGISVCNGRATVSPLAPGIGASST